MKLSLPAAAILALLSAPAGAAEVSRDLAPQGRQPRAAVTAAALTAVVYAEGERIHCRTSTDGESFGAPVAVGEVSRLLVGGRRGPQVAAAGASLVVTAIGRRGDLLAWRSEDAGRRWTGPVTVNDVPAAAREGLHALAGGAAESAHVVWLDLRDTGTRVYMSSTSDGGRTWGANRLVYRSPDGTVCECCQPTVAADAEGGVVVMWRNLVGGNRDMYLARSSDGGRTFDLAAKLGTGSWPLQACPMDGGGAAVRGRRVVTVWRREDTVFAAEPGAPERRLGRGKNAVVAFGEDGLYRAWQTEAEIAVETPGAPAAVVGRGGFPALAAAASGRGPVMLVWEDPRQGVRVLRLAPAVAGRPTH